MRRNLLFVSLFLTVSGAAIADRTSPTVTDSWSPVHAYIVDHAIYVSPGAEEKFYAEAMLGIETWEMVGESTSRNAKLVRGPGWPATGEAILLPNEAEAETLAGMIRAVTVGR